MIRCLNTVTCYCWNLRISASGFRFRGSSKYNSLQLEIPLKFSYHKDDYRITNWCHLEHLVNFTVFLKWNLTNDISEMYIHTNLLVGTLCRIFKTQPQTPCLWNQCKQSYHKIEKSSRHRNVMVPQGSPVCRNYCHEIRINHRFYQCYVCYEKK